MAKCPKCGSTNVKFQLRSAGTSSRSSYYRTGVKTSWFLPAGERSYKSRRKQISVGLCQNCGYHWEAGKDVYTPVLKDANALIILIGLFSLVIGIIGFISVITHEDVAYPFLQIIELTMLVTAGGLAIYDNSLPDKSAHRWIWSSASGGTYLGAGLLDVIFAFATRKSHIFSADMCMYCAFALISFFRSAHQYRRENEESQKSIKQAEMISVQNISIPKAIIPEENTGAHKSPVNPEYDDLLIDAAYFVLSEQRAGTAMLQRRFKIGFNRAGRIMDQLKQIGVIEYTNDFQTMYVRVTLKEFEERIVKNI